MWDEGCLGVPLYPLPLHPHRQENQNNGWCKSQETLQKCQSLLHPFPKGFLASDRLLRHCSKSKEKSQRILPCRGFFLAYFYFLFFIFFSFIYLFQVKTMDHFFTLMKSAFSSLAKISELMERLWLKSDWGRGGGGGREFRIRRFGGRGSRFLLAKYPYSNLVYYPSPANPIFDRWTIIEGEQVCSTSFRKERKKKKIWWTFW